MNEDKFYSTFNNLALLRKLGIDKRERLKLLLVEQIY